jgi:Cytochrome c554 and c-prime
MRSLLLLITAAAAAAAAAVRPPLTRDRFAGEDACRSCHSEEARTFRTTAHRLTMQPATRESIVAPFAPSAAEIATSDPQLRYRLEANDRGFFESSIVGPADAARIRTERIEMVIGSGKKGQSYIWSRNDELFQAPLSYWSALNTWAPNPGYTDRSAKFDVPVVPQCLDCHATFFERAAPPVGNRVNRASALLGVTCEKCHGPGAAHVAARRRNPKQAPPVETDVVNPARLARDQKVDLCASCHGGRKLGPPFSFLPGDSVNRTVIRPRETPSRDMSTGPAGSGIDSHGQQATALMSSRCFQQSTMTCETCHTPHATERNLAAFSARCLTCHKVEACGRYARDGRQIVDKCVDCHMPMQSSSLIVAMNGGAAATAQLRSHLIERPR